MNTMIDAKSPRGSNDSPALAPARMAWLDVARGIGMLLVIIGHALPKANIPLPLTAKWIYSFHIPLFFFISGLLIKDEARSYPWKRVVAKTARSLMLPYAFFGLISYILWLVALRHFGHHDGHSATLLSPLAGLLYGVSDSSLWYLNAPLWFFPCLFCTLLLHRALPKESVPEAVTVLLLFLAGLAFVKVSPLRLPWGLDLACLTLLFLYAGEKARPWLLGMTPAHRLKWLWAIPFLLLLQTLCAVYNSRVDLAKGQIGAPPLFLLGAFSGTLAAILASPFLPFRFLGSLMGRYTIIIFPLHLLCITLITAVFTVVPGLRRLAFLGYGTAAIYIILTCLSFIVIVPAVQMLFPWLTPAPKAPRRSAAGTIFAGGTAAPDAG